MELLKEIIENGKVNVIGSKPGKGKTSILIKFLYNIAVPNEKNVLVLTQEPIQDFVKIINRMVCTERSTDELGDFYLKIKSNIKLKKVDNFTTIGDIIEIISKYNTKFDYLIIDDAYHCLNQCTEETLLKLKSSIDSELLITTNMYDSVGVGSVDETPLISKLEDGSGLNIIHLKEIHITSDLDKVFLVRKNGVVIGSTVINFKELTLK